MLIALPSDYLDATARLLPAQAFWAAAGIAVVALVRWRSERVRSLGVAAIAIVAALDAAARQLLGEAWLGAVTEERLDVTVGPAVLYFGVVPSVITAVALLVANFVAPRVRRPPAAVAAAALIALAAVPLLHAQTPPEPRPNLLLVTIDTWRYDHLSAHPDAVDATLTPVLDALAERGHLFTEARAHVPLTVPSHATMLTGRAPWEHGILTNGGSIDAELPWLPEELRAAGYATGAVVSGAVIRGPRGFARGFDAFHDDLREPPAVDDLVGVRLARMLRGEDEPKVFRAEASRAVERAHAWLDRVPAGRPWFLWVHLYDVHLPHSVDDAAAAPFAAVALDGLTPPCDYADHPVPLTGPGGLGMPGAAGPDINPRVRERERERRCANVERLAERVAAYRAEVRVADAAVGDLLAAIDGRAETARTAVIVTADHGESLTEHGMRLAHQYSAYEPVLRVPLIVVPPGPPPAAGSRSAVLVQHRDLRATAQELLGLRPADDAAPWFGSRSLSHVTSVTHVPFIAGARLRARGEVDPDAPRAPVRVAVRDGRVSLVHTPAVGDEVYDLTADSAQVTDLASTSGAPAPPELRAAAEAVVRAVSRRKPEELEPDDPDLEALRALGYVE